MKASCLQSLLAQTISTKSYTILSTNNFGSHFYILLKTVNSQNVWVQPNSLFSYLIAQSFGASV